MVSSIKRIVFKLLPIGLPPINRWFNIYIYDNLRFLGDYVIIKRPFRYKYLSRNAIGNNVKICGLGCLDATSGIMIGDNTILKKGVNIYTSLNNKGNKKLAPVFIGRNNVIKDNLYAGSFIKNNDFSENVLDKLELIFIVGTGRSGTKAMAKNIDKSKAVIALHDPFIPIQYWAMEYFYSNDKFIRNQIIEMFNFSNTPKGKKIIISDHKYSAIIPLLNEIFPRSKFIHVMRRADSFVNSSTNRGWFSNDEINKKTSDLNAYIRLDPVRKECISETKWKEMSTFERNCWYWTYWNKLIEQNLSPIPKDRKLTLYLENLHDLSNINSFIGIRDNTNFQIYNQSKKKLKGKSHWSTDMIDSYNRWCTEYMIIHYGRN